MSVPVRYGDVVTLRADSNGVITAGVDTSGGFWVLNTTGDAYTKRGYMLVVESADDAKQVGDPVGFHDHIALRSALLGSYYMYAFPSNFSAGANAVMWTTLSAPLSQSQKVWFLIRSVTDPQSRAPLSYGDSAASVLLGYYIYQTTDNGGWSRSGCSESFPAVVDNSTGALLVQLQGGISGVPPCGWMTDTNWPCSNDHEKSCANLLCTGDDCPTCTNTDGVISLTQPSALANPCAYNCYNNLPCLGPPGSGMQCVTWRFFDMFGRVPTNDVGACLSACRNSACPGQDSACLDGCADACRWNQSEVLSYADASQAPTCRAANQKMGSFPCFTVGYGYTLSTGERLWYWNLPAGVFFMDADGTTKPMPVQTLQQTFTTAYSGTEVVMTIDGGCFENTGSGVLTPVAVGTTKYVQGSYDGPPDPMGGVRYMYGRYPPVPGTTQLCTGANLSQKSPMPNLPMAAGDNPCILPSPDYGGAFTIGVTVANASTQGTAVTVGVAGVAPVTIAAGASQPFAAAPAAAGAGVILTAYDSTGQQAQWHVRVNAGYTQPTVTVDPDGTAPTVADAYTDYTPGIQQGASSSASLRTRAGRCLVS